MSGSSFIPEVIAADVEKRLIIRVRSIMHPIRESSIGVESTAARTCSTRRVDHCCCPLRDGTHTGSQYDVNARSKFRTLIQSSCWRSVWNWDNR